MNVTIQWSKGATPVLSIYNATGHKTNSIDLTQYDDKDRLNEFDVVITISIDIPTIIIIIIYYFI